MTAFDGKQFGLDIVKAFKAHIEEVTRPLLQRIDALENELDAERQKAIGAETIKAMIADAGEPGKSVDVMEVKAMVADQVKTAVSEASKALPVPRDGVGVAGALINRKGELVLTLSDGTQKDLGVVVGESVDAKSVEAMVTSAVADAVEKLPQPKDGKDADVAAAVEQVRAAYAPMFEELSATIKTTLDEIEIPQAPELPALPDFGVLIDGAVKSAVAELPVPRDGKDADVAEIENTISDKVTEAFNAIEAPKDGTSVTVDDVAPLIEELVSKAADAIRADLPEPAQPINLVKTFVDREGHLILSMSDGTAHDVGPVVGKDADMDALEAQLQKAIDAIPAPQDGKDGMGFDDISIEHDGERCFKFVLTRGERVKSFDFAVPVVIDRGTYELGKRYALGDGITHGGSFWIARKDGATEKPGEGDEWRLAVKRGKDAREPVSIGRKG